MRAEINAFLAKTRMAKTTFGRGAMNDAGLIDDLDAGRELRWQSIEDCRVFMRTGEMAPRRAMAIAKAAAK